MRKKEEEKERKKKKHRAKNRGKNLETITMATFDQCSLQSVGGGGEGRGVGHSLCPRL